MRRPDKKRILYMPKHNWGSRGEHDSSYDQLNWETIPARGIRHAPRDIWNNDCYVYSMKQNNVNSP